MGYKKRAAAFLCGAAAIVMAAASAVTAFAFETVKMDDRKDQITAGKVNVVADEIYAKAGETVSYQVQIKENTGYAGIGVALHYDPALKIKNTDEETAVMTRGEASDGMNVHQVLNQPKNLFAFSGMISETTKLEGVLYTIQVIVPADAEPGTKYPMTLTMDEFNDSARDPLPYSLVDGWIEIVAPETTTAKPAVTTTTAKPAETTTPAPMGTTVTAPKDVTTSTSVQTTARQTDVTTTPETEISTVSSTKKTDRDPTKNVTTSANGNSSGGGNQQQNNSNKNNNNSNNTKTDGVKTGDTGIAVALAALLLAGSSAVVFGRRKKHE